MFGCIWQCFVNRQNSVQMGWNGAINAQVCAMKSHRNFSQLTHPNPLIGILTHVLVRFVVFWCILDCFVTAWNRCKTGWTGPINAKVHATKSHHNFWQRTHPDPPHWTVNLCFGAFCSVWEHFGLFRYSTKLDAKWAAMVELMHKFVAWNRIESFRNECTRYTQLDPKLLFWCVS